MDHSPLSPTSEPVPTKPTKPTVLVKKPPPLVPIITTTLGTAGSIINLPVIKNIGILKPPQPQDSQNSKINLKLLQDPKNTVSLKFF